ncbi:hypothetical protein JXA48_00545 [Candidatus Woesearchaeota archaeon]|nr:hypothetical protein [Candidatus Woesearchaeota archaeon]
MKHTSKVTILLVSFFLLTQFLALFLVSGEVQPNITLEENQTIVSINSTLITEVPANIFDWKAIIYLAVGISLGTGLILLLRKLSFGGKLWKVWYFLAVYVAINFALKLLFSLTRISLAAITLISSILALTLAFLKVRKYNFYIHNITEMLMYSGIGTFIVILFNNNILFVSILLFLIAMYDMIAVWKSGHMIKLAKFTTDNKLFPGFTMNYDSKKGNTKIITNDTKITKTSETKNIKKRTRQAILGGGDVVFPIIFSGVVLGWLFNKGFTRMQSFGLSLITTVFAALALYLLFYYSKKDKFYPAMPFIASGCYLGLGILYLVLLFI